MEVTLINEFIGPVIGIDCVVTKFKQYKLVCTGMRKQAYALVPCIIKLVYVGRSNKRLIHKDRNSGSNIFSFSYNM